MQNPLQITFRGFSHPDAVEARIREKANKLDKFYPHIMSCRVVVESEHHNHHQGNLYHMRIDIATPQKQIVVSQEHHDNHAHEDVYVVIRDGFNSAKRQLEDHANIQRGNVKAHPEHFEQKEMEAEIDELALFGEEETEKDRRSNN